jgi:glycosyltransferase involved in cell wall biosynthesis
MKKNYFSKYKYNHKCIKKIICVSEAIRGMYLPAIQDTSKVTTIRSGIDISRFKYQASSILRKEFDIDADTLLIGNVAAISPHKDYFTFIDTVKLLQAAGIKAKYLAIGNQEDTEETTCIRQYIQAQELSEVIILTGHRTDIPQILPELDVFLFTSKTEGLGTSLLDAFACRVPVVATKAGGVPELVIHEQTGLLVPIQRPDLLAAEVLRLLQNSTLRQQLVHHAQEYLQNFTKENTAEKTLEVYESVLGNIQDKS